ncbi:hypothetical protein LTR66_014169 [Elasticomyces elasticus]|nr:hypothetical protein LTR66_014169 [Elasticomyces elasticus]KAK5007974.1 hypothetical protein LTR28_004604 [Elasticomyces elasticus]
MGVARSTSTRCEGKVDGRPATFYYHRDEEEDRGLRYAFGIDLGPDNFTTREDADYIPAQNIIAVLPAQTALHDDYVVLFVEEHRTPSGADEEDSTYALPVVRSMAATSLPSGLVEDFAPSALSCWSTCSGDSSEDISLHVIVSSGSGARLAERFYVSAVKQVLGHVGLQQDTQYMVHYTQSESTITDLVYSTILPKANEGVSQAIILLSGDGGVVDVVNALMSGTRSERYVKPNIAILPFGTGNALAHSLKITTDKTMGLSTMLRGHRHNLPIFQATFSPGARLLVNQGRDEQDLHRDQAQGGAPTVFGAVVCSWGLHAGLVADSDTAEYRKFGAERFQMAAKEALFPTDGSTPHAYKGTVSILRRNSSRGAQSQDGAAEEWHGLERSEHAYVLATLVSDLEKGFTVSPASEPLDGKLRLVQFAPQEGDEVMRIMGLAYQGGKHVEEDAVGYEEIEGLRIRFEEEDARWSRVCVDGKIVRVERDGWVVVRKVVEEVVDVVCMAV